MTSDQEFAKRRLQHADMVLYFRGKYEQGEVFETYRAARMILWQACNRVVTGDEPEAIEPYEHGEDIAALKTLAVVLDKAPMRVRRASINWLAEKFLGTRC